jgi:hypothetical protein
MNSASKNSAGMNGESNLDRAGARLTPGVHQWRQPRQVPCRPPLVASD